MYPLPPPSERMNLENLSWWRRYLDPKGIQKGGREDRSKPNDKSSANNKSVDPRMILASPSPPLKNRRGRVWVERGRVLREIRRVLNPFFPSWKSSLEEFPPSRNLFSSSSFFLFSFLSFYRVLLVGFQRGSVVCIYIYMVNREQFVHWQKHISERDQREVVEEKLRDNE